MENFPIFGKFADLKNAIHERLMAPNQQRYTEDLAAHAVHKIK